MPGADASDFICTRVDTRGFGPLLHSDRLHGHRQHLFPEEGVGFLYAFFGDSDVHDEFPSEDAVKAPRLRNLWAGVL
jgi:hypothetical protein